MKIEKKIIKKYINNGIYSYRVKIIKGENKLRLPLDFDYLM